MRINTTTKDTKKNLDADCTDYAGNFGVVKERSSGRIGRQFKK
jgi:hypothetical protein